MEESDHNAGGVSDSIGIGETETADDHFRGVLDSQCEEEYEEENDYIFDVCTKSRLDTVKKSIHFHQWRRDDDTNQLMRDENGRLIKCPSIAERISQLYGFCWTQDDTNRLAGKIVALLRCRWNQGGNTSYCGYLDPSSLLVGLLLAFAGDANNTEFKKVENGELRGKKSSEAMTYLLNVVRNHLSNTFKKWKSEVARNQPISKVGETEEFDTPEQLKVFDDNRFALGLGKETLEERNNKLEERISREIKKEKIFTPDYTYPDEFLYWFSDAELKFEYLNKHYQSISNDREREKFRDEVCMDVALNKQRFPGVMQYVRAALTSRYNALGQAVPKRFIDDANEFNRVRKERDNVFLRIQKELEEH